MIRWFLGHLFYEFMLSLGIVPQLTPEEKKLARKLAKQGIKYQRDQRPLVYYARQLAGAGQEDDYDEEDYGEWQ